MINRISQISKTSSCSKNGIDARFPYNSFGASKVAMLSLEKKGDWCVFYWILSASVSPCIAFSNDFHWDSSNNLEFPYRLVSP